MPYPTPTQSFDSVEHARNKILRANQFQELVITQFKAAYEDFWGVNAVNGGSRYTTAEMQAILDAMPIATAMDILQDAAEFTAFVVGAYPDELEAKYHESAWEYTVGAGGLTLTTLRDAWEPNVTTDTE